MNSSCFVDSTARSSNVNRRKTKMQLSQVIESYLLEGIHARVFSRLSDEHRYVVLLVFFCFVLFSFFVFLFFGVSLLSSACVSFFFFFQVCL